jgi:hypothetical protein
MLYNPLDHVVRKPMELPLYYTGLTDAARIREEDGRWQKFKLDRRYHVLVPVTIPASGCTWLVIERP